MFRFGALVLLGHIYRLLASADNRSTSVLILMSVTPFRLENDQLGGSPCLSA